jgi:hypothetical protein
MKTNFEPNSTAAASDPTPARLSLIRFPAICVAALCLSTNLFAAPVEMTFDGVNGVTSFGVYVSPYYGTIDGTPVDLFCVDFSNEVHFGEQWAANLTPISSAADLGDTRWGAQPDALVHYEEAAWLALQFASQPVDQYGDIQATMWQLFYPGAPSPSSSFWLDQAQSNYASADYQTSRSSPIRARCSRPGRSRSFSLNCRRTGRSIHSLRCRRMWRPSPERRR